MVIPSPFTGFDQRRDMQYLLDQTMMSNPDWIISIDGDEELVQSDEDAIRIALASANGVSRFTLKILYLWDREDQVRVDGVYGNFRRPRIFKPEAGTAFRGGLHNTGAGHISGASGRIVDLGARLLHYGYLHREDRLRKYHWHNQQIDPNNTAEDSYRHMVQGDLPEIPAGAKLKHAGPLTLKPLCL
jgi:hypothetical protein